MKNRRSALNDVDEQVPHIATTMQNVLKMMPPGADVAVKHVGQHGILYVAVRIPHLHEVIDGIDSAHVVDAEIVDVAASASASCG